MNIGSLEWKKSSRSMTNGACVEVAWTLASSSSSPVAELQTLR
ncbi:DUF397 domain-containing protein [Actinomadura sp. DC4]